MELNELLDAYLAKLLSDEKNLMNIAFDEMNSSQYEEAASHFDQLYVKNSNDFMSYYFRAYCKSHCGKRGDVLPDSQKLTSAFQLTYKKAIENKEDLDLNLEIIVDMYIDAMDNLAYNAVEEVRVNSNGTTSTSNPTKYRILINCQNTISDFISENIELINELGGFKEYVLSYLKKDVKSNLNKYGPLIVKLDPSYSKQYEELQKKAKTKKIIKLVILLGIIATIVIIAVVSALK